MEKFKFNDKTYAFDLDRLMEWIGSPVEGNSDQLQTTVTEVWAKPDEEIDENGEINNDLDLVTREMTDVKSDSSLSNAKFEMMRNLLDVILNINYTPDGNLKTQETLTLSETLCLNTLIKEQIIYEIEENEQ